MKCEYLIIGNMTGYMFCKDRGYQKVDKKYCENCILNKELNIEIEKGKAFVLARIANSIFKKGR